MILIQYMNYRINIGCMSRVNQMFLKEFVVEDVSEKWNNDFYFSRWEKKFSMVFENFWKQM